MSVLTSFLCCNKLLQISVQNLRGNIYYFSVIYRKKFRREKQKQTRGMAEETWSHQTQQKIKRDKTKNNEHYLNKKKGTLAEVSNADIEHNKKPKTKKES